MVRSRPTWRDTTGRNHVVAAADAIDVAIKGTEDAEDVGVALGLRHLAGEFKQRSTYSGAIRTVATGARQKAPTSLLC
jgi:hypothetical protein